MCPKDGTMNSLCEIVKSTIVNQNGEFPDGPIRCLEIEHNKVSKIIPLETSGNTIYEWNQGFSKPNIQVRMEVIPLEERNISEGDKLVWCHSFSSPGAQGYGPTHGVPFSIVVKQGETVAELKVRLAARLGESIESVKRSWKICTHALYKYESLADGI